LVEPARLTTVDYYEVDSPDLRAGVSWRVARAGTAHGIAVWFDAELADGIGFSNHPGVEELIYGNGFFPFSRPVAVAEGEQLNLKLRADLVRDDYVWSWDTDFTDQKLGFRQSTFFGVALSSEELRKKYAQHS
jgi:protein arginine N-methyltransferase 1